MKRNVGFLLIGAGLLSLLYFLNPIGVFTWTGFSFGTEEIYLEKSVDSSSLNKLELDVGSADVKVTRGSGDQARVTLSGRASSNYADKLDLKVETRGDTLVLGLNQDVVSIGFKVLDIEMNVELPEKQWKSAKLETGSGNIDLAELKGDSIGIKVGSGNISAQEIAFQKIELNGGSGNATLSQIETDQMDLQLASGNLNVTKYTADLLKFDLGSGNVELFDGQSAVEGHVSSGNVRIEAEELLHNTDLKLGSGNATVELARQPKSLEVDFRGGSGNGQIGFTGIEYQEKSEEGDVLRGTFGSGDVKLNVQTSSGDFKLEEG
ncbi:DUF4097 family beta strand repeat-containing protein [Paenibacillus lutrae]|uniref:DUF4097 family beta strand repeat-containing protein n=1 Tax=Paenibacillus lutrae TaxID=2078573 RepID=UPI0012F72B65|nr:DUF4097 family beta strand repeat-containing protein [Paenibacillus lutrae]